MFCRNCANKITSEAIACPKCGVPPGKGKNFCFYCGNSTHEDAVICVNCGRSIDGISTPKNDFISTWSKWSYSNYILILLFSLLSFANIQCGEQKVFKVTGLNLAVGMEKPSFFRENTDSDFRRYNKQLALNDDTVISYEISIFYVLIIACLMILLTSTKRRFIIVRGLTIIGLLLISFWFISSNIRLSRSPNALIDVSYGVGFWLTIFMLIFTLILLSSYIRFCKKKVQMAI